MENQYKDNEKKSKFTFGKLLVSAAIVLSAGTGAYIGQKLFTENNPDFASSQTTQLEIAKACTINAVKTLDGLSTRSLAKGSYDYQTKQDAKAIQDILEPLKTNGKGDFNISNPSQEDLQKILTACGTDDGYLATVQKAGEYLVTSHMSDKKTKYEQDETAVLKINVAKRTQAEDQSLVVSYKMR